TLYGVRYSDGQMFKTTDAAFSWNAVKTPWDPSLFHTGVLVADPKNSGTLYAATQEFDCGYYDVCPPDYYDKAKAAGGAGLFKTTDGGQSWVKLDGPAIDSLYFGNNLLAIDPRKPSTLYAKVQYAGSFYRSTDGGATWSALTAPFPMTFVTALVVDGQ